MGTNWLVDRMEEFPTRASVRWGGQFQKPSKGIAREVRNIRFNKGES